jgi:hypothetical protein
MQLHEKPITPEHIVEQTTFSVNAELYAFHGTRHVTSKMETMSCARMIFAIMEAGYTAAYQTFGISFNACWFA